MEYTYGVGNDGVTISSLTTATTLQAELPTITVAPENVHILLANNTPDAMEGEDEYFTKNAQ
jgi:hypothetical protein